MIILYIISWLLFCIFNTITIILGWLLVPPMAIFHKYTTKTIESVVNGRDILVWKHKFMFIWSNNEDGVVAGEELLNYPTWVRIIYWSALRNPSNNLRFIKALTCQIKPSKVQYKATALKNIDGLPPVSYIRSVYYYDSDEFRFISLTNCGIYSNLRIQFKMFNKIWRFWIGWKIYPHDMFGLSSTDYRRFGAGFATQFKRIYQRK